MIHITRSHRSVAPLLERAPRFADLIEGAADEAGHAALRGAETIGRPLGDRAFLATVAHRLGTSRHMVSMDTRVKSAYDG